MKHIARSQFFNTFCVVFGYFVITGCAQILTAKLTELSGAAGSGPYAGAKAKILAAKNAGMEATLDSDYKKVYETALEIAKAHIKILETEFG